MFAHDQYIVVVKNNIHKLIGYFLGISVVLSLFLLTLGHPEYTLILPLLCIFLFAAIHFIKNHHILLAGSLLSIYLLALVSFQLYFLGWDSGFQYYLLNLLPLILMLSPGHPQLTRVLLSLLVLGFVVLYFCFHHHVSDINQTLYQTLYILNAAMALIGLKFQISNFIHISSGYQTKVKELSELAYFDPLTGVMNRSGLKEKLPQLRLGQHNFVVICDIDHFKKINDTYGHLCGDYVLEETSHFLKKQLRSSDLITRWGGEEFVLIFPEAGLKETEKILYRIQSALRQHKIYFNQQKIQVSLTFGYMQFHSVDDFNSALKLADKALYQGKRAGRDTIVSALPVLSPDTQGSGLPL